jgi:hypothetical protein
MLVLAAGVPTVTPNTNTPLSGVLNKLLALFLGLLVIACLFFFFAGGFQILRSIGGHHDGGAAAGAIRMLAAAVFLAFLFIGTPLVNTWASFFGG